MRQLAGTKNEVPEGSRHSARQTHFWQRGVSWTDDAFRVNTF